MNVRTYSPKKLGKVKGREQLSSAGYLMQKPIKST